MQALLTAPVLPDLDDVVDQGTLGDEILMSAAASEKVQRVRGTGRNWSESESRAWTFGGNVD